MGILIENDHAACLLSNFESVMLMMLIYWEESLHTIKQIAKALVVASKDNVLIIIVFVPCT